MYREEVHLLADLAWVDFDFDRSAICPILLGQMEFWQTQLSSRARWWNIPNLSQLIPNLSSATGLLYE